MRNLSRTRISKSKPHNYYEYPCSKTHRKTAVEFTYKVDKTNQRQDEINKGPSSPGKEYIHDPRIPAVSDKGGIVPGRFAEPLPRDQPIGAGAKRKKC